MQDQLTLWPTEKRCKVCGKVKPVEAFYRASGRKCYRTVCMDCEKAVGRERIRAYRATRSTAINAARRAQYLKDNPGITQRPKLTREEARRRQDERSRAWVLANPERAQANLRRAQAKRRARLRGVQYVEHVEALVVLERADGVCGICGQDVDPFDFHVDHIVPVARGGEHSYQNTQPAHPSCNSRKGAKAP